MWDLHVTGREHLPKGPHVIAANHLSFIDPVIITLVERQSIRYLAVAGLFDTHPLFARLITFFAAIPTPRDRVPIAAVRTALAELDAGRPIGVFPEGRRVSHWREEHPQRGAAWLAMSAGVPLVPAAVLGAEGTLSQHVSAFTRTPVRVWVEPPLDPYAFVDHEDPVGALGHAWREAVGRRLDPWWPDSG